ncbi:MAG TPA: site-specific integrase [Dehalococcoidia bacterium]|nr:site-specific integrase [Dehalococcoidia bacterium]
MAVALKSRQDGLPIIVQRQSFGQFAATWLTAVRPALKPRTWLRYEQLLRIHALPAFGRVQITKLTYQDLQQRYAEMQANGSSAATVRQFHAVMHVVLRQAMKWDLVVRNVCDLVTPPRIARTERQVLSPEQARQILHEASGDSLEALYVLALTSGMRQGEILALHWKDVDLDHGTANVRLTLHRQKSGFVFAEPKSDRSRRQVALTAAARKALKEHHIRQAEARLQAGIAWQDLDLVFTTKSGAPLCGTHLLRDSFYPLLDRAGLPRMRFHDLRHSAATLLLGKGIHPKIVSEMLGHSTIAITLDLYSHVTPTMQREAAQALDSLLAGA